MKISTIIREVTDVAKKYNLQKVFLIAFILIFVFRFQSLAADLQMFSNTMLIEDTANDGDSFRVNAGGKEIHIRLYYVDCPEISVMSKSDARRVRDQTRYFGLQYPHQTVHFGHESKKWVAQILSRPFTVYTAFASALGRSKKGRVYGFITIADGDDLGSLLVKKGLARTYGVGRKTPDGTPREEMTLRLHDLETASMLKRSGAWAESDPDRIAELRAEQREEDRKLRELQQQVKSNISPPNQLDLNKATQRDLESIPGIGPALASRIIAGRPYITLDDLISVKGIGKKKLEKIQSYFVVNK